MTFFYLCTSPSLSANPPQHVNDVTRLNPTDVRKIVKVHTIDDIKKAFLLAKENNLKICIAGKRHSQGGQQFYQNGILLDMLSFNKVLSLDRKNRIITVESGASWAQIQNYINSYGLAIKVMQASNIFTVGGSMSINIHGNDPNYGCMIETIRSFRLFSPDGSIKNVSRSENPELFHLVLGGYGLFGIILDADLELTDDVIYEKTSTLMNYKTYPTFFKTHIMGNRKVGLHSAKLSSAPDSFLREIVETTYKVSEKTDKSIFVLQEERNISRNKFFFGLSRTFDWGKNLRWFLEKKWDAKIGKKEVISRNNAMRSMVKFLDYHSVCDTDILQDYAIPVEKFVLFIDGLREIAKKRNINLLSITIRYLPRDNESFLPFAQKDSFSFALYINQKLSPDGIKDAKRWTQEIVDLALRCGGTFYLAYQVYPSKEQLKRAYSQLDFFLQKKKFYDESETFSSNFYEKFLK